MLEEHFTKAGVVKKASLITDRNNRRSKGIAYIEFKEVASVQIALGLNGEKLNKAPLIIMMTHSEKNRQVRTLVTGRRLVPPKSYPPSTNTHTQKPMAAIT